MHTNKLAEEKSPYLLQHAHNPVDWQAWGPEAFEKARREDKPIFLSIGYSTCHWCHVMERESFESERIAALLNRDFVPVKVDREERPDVDRIYMAYVQALTGGGGWPMSVWLTPDLKPFHGGTYFPPDDRAGSLGFASVLGRIAEAWRNDRARIVGAAREVLEHLKQQAMVAPSRPGSALALDMVAIDSGFVGFRRSFDSHLGGFGGAPKFPRPATLGFLMRYYSRARSEEALEMAAHTLREMAKGGIHDHLGGGFHRYSVDERWFVPHFEKMLYDQAQLATSYLEAFQITREPVFAQTARGILDYVLRDLTDAEGGFYSAEDADSAADHARPRMKSEGAFYVWSESEIRALLPQPAADWFCYAHGVAPSGNVRTDPHGEFAGKNILYRANDDEETAEHFDAPVDAVRAGVSRAASALLELRSMRPRPHLDDKTLTGWNGLMISALALGGAVLESPRYAAAARRAAEFLIARMLHPSSGLLLRRYRLGDAAIPGFLDDYAFFAQALLDLYETQFDLRHLQLAIRLTEKQRELFEDPEGGFFASTADAGDLVIRMKDDYDGAEPSGNSVAVLNLLRLAQMTAREDFRESAARTLEAFAPRLAAVPVALPAMLSAYDFYESAPKQIVLAGAPDAPGMAELCAALHSRFAPRKVVLAVDSQDARATLASRIPAIASMTAVDGRAAAYVCENYTCRLPVCEAAELTELLQ